MGWVQFAVRSWCSVYLAGVAGLPTDAGNQRLCPRRRFPCTPPCLVR